ncbi:MAG: hypothetical protein J7647_32705 [Cyanobacteria bacterium SBLK]|nr:hypothetical protein [Cyanobacteria bacterium SBLK]
METIQTKFAICIENNNNFTSQHWQDNEAETNPWVRFSGMFKDDPFFDEFVEEIAAYRRKINEEALDNEYFSNLEDYEEKLARGEIQFIHGYFIGQGGSSPKVTLFNCIQNIRFSTGVQTSKIKEKEK